MSPFSAGASGPMVVVSNRLPYNAQREPGGRPPKRNVGGLVNALEPVLVARGGSWVGWDGVYRSSSEALSPASSRPAAARAPSGIPMYGVPLTSKEVERYYHGCANRAIWPLFHDFPGKAVFAHHDYAAYVSVNRRFAEIAMARAGAEGRVWVQDYQLMLVPYFLKEMGFRGRVDFFLHIPFPAPEIFRALPWRAEALAGLLAADSVGFHVELYRDNFVAAASMLAGARPGVPDGRNRIPIRHARGKSLALVAPIGIDVEDFERISNRSSVAALTSRLRQAHKDCKIIFGADRLDYTKGIGERLAALECYLEEHADAARKVVLIQVVVPSRHQVEEYKAQKREIDREVGRINGMFGRVGWVPIHYLYRALDREDLVAYYKAADVALVTPLRDGMNLVAPEFAASRVDEDGILIISEFAGIAARCEGALLVNPYDVRGTAGAISEALGMEADERRRRMRSLRRVVRSNPLSQWAVQCLGPDTVHPATSAPRFRGRTFREAPAGK